MIVDTVKWFHQVMGHPDEKRIQDMLNQCFYHPKLCYHIDKLNAKIAKSIKYQAMAMVSYPNEWSG
jgi:hypothetical protein